MNCPRQDENRVGGAEVAPGMSARATHDHFKAPAAEGFGDDGVRACAVKDEAAPNGVLPWRMGKNVAHAAKIAFPLFPHVPDENDGQGKPDAASGQCRGHGKQRRYSCAVVGDARAVEPTAVLTNV